MRLRILPANPKPIVMFYLNIRKILFLITLGVLFLFSKTVQSQTMPEVFEDGNLQEQFDYLQQRTNIYNNFRAIREDMFRKIRSNSLDSLAASQEEIASLKETLINRQNENQELQQTLEAAVTEKDKAIAERDSLSFLGLMLGKNLYNLIVWSVIGGLVVLLALLFFLFKRAQVIASQKRSELTELKAEFETYKKTSRERFEKQSIDHFNEVKRLRGI